MHEQRPPGDAILFAVETPLGFRVHTTVSYWELITAVKHPAMRGRAEDVKTALSQPDQVRISKSDETVAA